MNYALPDRLKAEPRAFLSPKNDDARVIETRPSLMSTREREGESESVLARPARLIPSD